MSILIALSLTGIWPADFSRIHDSFARLQMKREYDDARISAYF